jgi:biopolymer transport protein ExbB
MKVPVTLSLLTMASASPLFAQTQGNAAETISSQSLWQMVESVGLVLIPLGILSILVIGLIVFNFFWLRQSNIASDEFVNATGRDLVDRDLETVLDRCERSKEMAAKVLGKLILFARDNPNADLDSLKTVAEAEGSRQVLRINQPNLILMDLGVMAPMVGLLGTVVGILSSFGSIASDNTPNRSVMLAGGVSQALIATAIGLIIGLTAMFFYSWFRSRVQGLIGRFEQAVTELSVKTFVRLASGK